MMAIAGHLKVVVLVSNRSLDRMRMQKSPGHYMLQTQEIAILQRDQGLQLVGIDIGLVGDICNILPTDDEDIVVVSMMIAGHLLLLGSLGVERCVRVQVAALAPQLPDGDLGTEVDV